jgi:very-short-patch-repair endonuclease
VSSTDAEKKFWAKVRNRQPAGAKFRRQWPIGSYIADFCCVERHLIIELDSGQHADNSKDVVCTKALEKLGYRVVRFWNNDVLANIDGVVQEVLGHLKENDPSPAR